MFQDLDGTLEKLIRQAATPEFDPLRAAEVSFAMPDKEFKPVNENPTVNLYLYETHENRELRDPVPIVRLRGQEFVRSRPPLRVDCRYLLTAWAKDDGDKVKTEHQLLGQSLRWLSRFPLIPAELDNQAILVGGLKDPAFPHPTMTAQMDDGKRLGEFWSALGIPPRPCFIVVVTLAMDLGVEWDAGPRVAAKQFRDGIRSPDGTQQLVPGTAGTQTLQIGGIVFGPDPDGVDKPLGGVDVQLLERELTTRTDAFGRYAFRLKGAGEFTLRTLPYADPATGREYSPAEKQIKVPLNAGDPLDSYDVALTPA